MSAEEVTARVVRRDSEAPADEGVPAGTPAHSAEDAEDAASMWNADTAGQGGSGPIGRVADLGRDIGSYIRHQRSSAQISLRQLSKLAGVSNPYLSQIERGLRKPSAEILQQIAKGLRISAEALYVQAGFLDDPVGGPVTEAVRADTDLTERQKQVLLDVYDSFRRGNRATGPVRDAADPASVVDTAFAEAADATIAVPTGDPADRAGRVDTLGADGADEADTAFDHVGSDADGPGTKE